MAGVLSYCKIENMEVTPRMSHYLMEIDSKVQLGNYLAVSLSSIPLLELFTTRVKPHTRLKDIGEYDWEQFGNSMGAVHPITKQLVNTIADEARMFSSGKEADFWKCVYEATR
ncbi:hypothetical protein H8F10_00210 [Vibrio fluvialis]|uniref:hypothetical protein n=1 Tax=Vibrio fluvialis TaxID=676 RepID=UPI00192A9848|nr:hypothetical protein [Vibrio fluvialis]MBL4276332.1 hypothetical protein [Vibrio fluvialis]MCG6350427.1 hypothetical protein [Vibrio fluvialis]